MPQTESILTKITVSSHNQYRLLGIMNIRDRVDRFAYGHLRDESHSENFVLSVLSKDNNLI